MEVLTAGRGKRRPDVGPDAIDADGAASGVRVVEGSGLVTYVLDHRSCMGSSEPSGNLTTGAEDFTQLSMSTE